MPAFQRRAIAWPGLFVSFLAFLLAGALVATNARAESGTTAPDRLPAVTSAAQIMPVEVVVAEALQSNPEIAGARSARDAARERVSPAGSLEDPMFEAGVLNAPLSSLSFRREDMTMKMLGLSQKLPFPGKRDLRRQVAAREADAVGYA